MFWNIIKFKFRLCLCIILDWKHVNQHLIILNSLWLIEIRLYIAREWLSGFFQMHKVNCEVLFLTSKIIVLLSVEFFPLRIAFISWFLGFGVYFLWLLLSLGMDFRVISVERKYWFFLFYHLGISPITWKVSVSPETLERRVCG